MSVTAIIPVRDFDNYIQNKNLLPFASGTLLSYKIGVLGSVKEIDQVVVYTESEELAKHAATFHEVVILRRPPRLAHPEVYFHDLVKDVMSRIDRTTVIWTHATSPLVDRQDFVLGLEAYKAARQRGFDSLVTVRPVKRHILDVNGPLNFRRNLTNRSNILTPDLYSVTGAFSIGSSDDMAEWGYNWGRAPFLYELPPGKSVDICTMDDYRIALKLFEPDK